ncbi:ExbD/TolR family protein [Marinobacter sp. C2H3]|uniref:ExbD/TolR family protein n=1 Tax=Marinobacter sp. C2H3 TaxID=3119003 RepID=UPI00300F58B8
MRRRHRRLNHAPDLDITAFMNLMIVLVPVLLLGMVFSQMRTIDLNFPGQGGEPPPADQVQLQITLLPGGLSVADSKRGEIKALPLTNGQQDFEGLRETMKALKARWPEKTDLVLQVGPDVDYQTLVTTLDTVRSYPTVVAASVVQAELFPDIALMDAPPATSVSSGGGA